MKKPFTKRLAFASASHEKSHRDYVFVVNISTNNIIISYLLFLARVIPSFRIRQSIYITSHAFTPCINILAIRIHDIQIISLHMT